MKQINITFAWNYHLKLRAEGDKLWAEAILEYYGDVKITWIYRLDKKSTACEIEGEIFEP